MSFAFITALASIAAAGASGSDCTARKGGALAVGDCYASRGQWKEAEEHYRRHRNENPQSAAGAVRHAQSLVQLNQPFDAVLEIEELLKAHPDHVPALKLYAGLLDTVVKDVTGAGKVLERCAKLAPNDADAWKLLGNHYLAKREVGEAVRCYREAARLKPADPLILAGLAVCLGQAGLAKEAENLFARAIRFTEKTAKPDPAVYLLYGESLAGQERVAESVPVFTNALLRDWHSGTAYYWRAAALEKLEDYRRAETDALAALRESSDQKAIHLLLVRIYRGQGRIEKAEEHAAIVSKLSEQESAEHGRARAVRAALRAGEPLLKEGKCAEAIPHYQEIVRLLPTFYEAHFALGVCYSQTGRPRDAETSLRTFLSLQPLSPDGHAAFGILLLGEQRSIEARSELEEAVRLDPRAVEPRKALAHIYSSISDHAAAVRVLKPAASGADADAQTLLMLAEALALAGDVNSALAEVERVLKMEPANAGALELKRKIAGR
jgi:tetratricopeptide (TPR) repeat protein